MNEEPGLRPLKGKTESPMPLICGACRHKWKDAQSFPVDISAWLKKLRKIKCPNCGAGRKDLKIPFGDEAASILQANRR